MSGLEDVLAAHEIRSCFPAGLAKFSILCRCGVSRHDVTLGDHRAHVADAIRAWLLSDAVIEVAAETLFANEFGEWKPDAHADHNRWTWRGDGHSDEFRDGYRRVTREAITAVIEGERP